jgi:putative membrane protein
MQGNYSEMHLRRRGLFGWVVASIVLVAVIAFIVALATHSYPYSPSTPYYGYPYFGWFFFPFGFFFIFFIIFAVSRFIFWPWGWGGGWRRGYWYHYGDAREILRQRYARGEITKEQYDQMMRDLEQHQ